MKVGRNIQNLVPWTTSESLTRWTSSMLAQSQHSEQECVAATKQQLCGFLSAGLKQKQWAAAMSVTQQEASAKYDHVSMLCVSE